jgi:tetratricopeptide (TPR) repeat protein
MLAAFRGCIAAFLVSVAFCSIACAAAPADNVQRGVDAFNARQYERALQLFTAAYDAGIRTPSLQYNLGIVYLRLARYDESLEHFHLVADDPTWGALALYNMGLIEERRGRISLALSHYRLANERAETPRVRQLVAAKLHALNTGTTREADNEVWRGIISAGSGMDDNVLLLGDDNLGAATNEDDYYVEARGAASRYLRGNFDDGWRLGLGAYYRAYNELDDFNFGAANAGLSYVRMLDTWHFQVGSKAELQFAGGEHFSTAGILGSEVTRMFQSWVLRVRDELSVIEGGSSYAFVSGWQNRSGVDLTRRSRNGRLRFGYELELNDRDDLVIGDEYFSYSPVRHKVFADARVELSAQFRVDAHLEYRASGYADANVQVNADGSVTTAKRDEDRIAGMLRLEYEFIPSWDVFSEFFYASNDSNFDRYTYDNSQVMIGLERSF